MDTAWLDFFSTLIWQLIVVFLLLAFRSQIAALLARVASFKVGDAEFTFQSPAEDAAPATETKVEVQSIGPGGFFTKAGVKQLVAGSGMLQGDDAVRDSLLIFRTS